jgi:hypothetical protein
VVDRDPSRDELVEGRPAGGRYLQRPLDELDLCVDRCGEHEVEDRLEPSCSRSTRPTRPNEALPVSCAASPASLPISASRANEAIGAELRIAAETVRTHIRKAMAKLDADTRTQAVATALRQSLIS